MMQWFKRQIVVLCIIRIHAVVTYVMLHKKCYKANGGIELMMPCIMLHYFGQTQELTKFCIAQKLYRQ